MSTQNIDGIKWVNRKSNEEVLASVNENRTLLNTIMKTLRDIRGKKMLIKVLEDISEREKWRR